MAVFFYPHSLLPWPLREAITESFPNLTPEQPNTQTRLIQKKAAKRNMNGRRIFLTKKFSYELSLRDVIITFHCTVGSRYQVENTDFAIKSKYVFSPLIFESGLVVVKTSKRIVLKITTFILKSMVFPAIWFVENWLILQSRYWLATIASSGFKIN